MGDGTERFDFDHVDRGVCFDFVFVVDALAARISNGEIFA